MDPKILAIILFHLFSREIFFKQSDFFLFIDRQVFIILAKLRKG